MLRLVTPPEEELRTLFEEYKSCNSKSMCRIFNLCYFKLIASANEHLGEDVDFFPDDIVGIRLRRFVKRKRKKKKKFYIKTGKSVTDFLDDRIKELCQEKNRQSKKLTHYYRKLPINEELIEGIIEDQSLLNYQVLLLHHSNHYLYTLFKKVATEANLSTLQQKILLLVFHGNCNSTIANKLGVSYANVTNSKTRAIRKIESKLKKL